MILVALFWSRASIGRALLGVALASLTIASAYWLVMEFLPALAGETLEVFEIEGLRTNRPQVWKTYTEIILAHPFGVGLDIENLIRVASRYGLHIYNAHNIYLNIAVSTGVTGLIMFLAIITLLLGRLVRALSRAAAGLQQQTLMYLFLGVAGFLVVGLVEPIYTLAPKLNQFFWLLSGIGAAASARVLAESRVRESNLVSPPSADPLGSLSGDDGCEVASWKA
jgi:O-antigen ligase